MAWEAGVACPLGHRLALLLPAGCVTFNDAFTLMASVS